MTEKDEKQLKNEIAHIFESGANEIRVFEMVKIFINSRRDIYKSEFVTELQNSYAKEHLRYQIIHKGNGMSYNSKLYMSKDNAELDCPNDDYAVSVLFLT